MHSFQWTIKVKMKVGSLPVGAWVEIIKPQPITPSLREIYKAFEDKYGVKLPLASHLCFDVRKDF